MTRIVLALTFSMVLTAPLAGFAQDDPGTTEDGPSRRRMRRFGPEGEGQEGQPAPGETDRRRRDPNGPIVVSPGAPAEPGDTPDRRRRDPNGPPVVVPVGPAEPPPPVVTPVVPDREPPAVVPVVVPGQTPGPGDWRRRPPPGPGEVVPVGAITVESMTPNPAPPGATVVLRGTFPPDATVSMGRQPIATRPEGPNGLAFEVPAMPAGPQRVMVHSGGEHVSAGQLNVLGAPGDPVVERPDFERPDFDRDGARRDPERRRRRWERRFRERTVISSFSPRAGTAGTLITINGRHIDPDVEVYFADTQLTPLSVDEASITFRVPRGTTGENAITVRVPPGPPLVVGTFEVGRRVAPRGPTAAQLRAEAEREWAERIANLEATAPARLAALAAQEDVLRMSRPERARQQRAALLEAFDAALLAETTVIDELALHANRTARLERMRRLAEANLEQELGLRIGVLARREEQRHQQRINDLRTAVLAVTP